MTLVTIPNRPAGTDQRSIELILADFDAITTVMNGGLDASNMAPGFLSGLGGSALGKSIVATSESRTNAAYGLMPTPDRVSGVVLPANGLLAVWYQATWQESIVGQALAAIFVGANQAKISTSTSPSTQAALIPASGATANTNASLGTSNAGLVSGASSSGYTGDVTTGQIVGVAGAGTGAGEKIGSSPITTVGAFPGGPCFLFAAAGTYDISVQYLAGAGTVTVSNRKLWVGVWS